MWHAVAVARCSTQKKSPNRITRPWEAATFEDLWRITPSDFDYFITEVENRPSLDDKLVALTAAIRVDMTENADQGRRLKLVSAASSHQELSDRLAQHLNPLPPSPEEKQWKAQEAKWKKQSEERRTKEDANRADWRRHLKEQVAAIANPQGLKSGKITRDQWYLLNFIREKSEGSSKWSNGNWEVLIPEFGEEVAFAFRDSAISY